MARTIRKDLHAVQSVRPDIVIVQLGTTDLSFRAPLLVDSDPEDFFRLLHASYGIQFVVYAKLFAVVWRCRSTKTCHFNAPPSSSIRRLGTDATRHLLSRGFWKEHYHFLVLQMAFI